MALLQQREGGYAFIPLSGRSPYSGGVVAAPGYEIVHATLEQPIPWREGFRRIERHLSAQNRPRTALCAIELRCARPYPPEQWLAPGSFNQDYQGLLREWGLFVEGENPVARTNVNPAIDPPAEQALYAFSYTVPSDASNPPTFVVAGAAELPDVRSGETSTDALREKTRNVMTSMQTRLCGLGRDWGESTSIGVYTVYDVWPILVEEVLRPVGPAARNGLHWFDTRPPIEKREIEIDVRGVRQDVRISTGG